MLIRLFSVLLFFGLGTLPFLNATSEQASSPHDLTENVYLNYCEQNGFYFRDDELHFCGRLELSHGAEFEDLVKTKSPDVFVINSGGGNTLAAILIGRTILAHELNVRVTGRCLSACAHFVFMPAKNVFVETDAFIAFHHNATASFTLLHVNGLLPTEHTDEYKKLVAIENLFYASAGLPIEWLYEPYWRMAPDCFGDYIYNSNDQIIGSSYKSRLKFWTPTRDFIDKVRPTPIKGWWPKDEVEFSIALFPITSTIDMKKYKFQLDKNTDFSTQTPPKLGKCAQQLSSN